MRFLAGRIVQSVIVLVGVTLLVFTILRLAPGDPASMLLSHGGSEQQIQELRESLGFTGSIAAQALVFVGNVLRGDLGQSIVFQRPALDLLIEALPSSLYLGLVAFAVTMLVAVPAGIVMAVRPAGILARLSDGLVLFSQSMPSFWVGMMLIFFFAVQLGWLPTSGNEQWSAVLLPALTLSMFQWAIVARTVQSAMNDVLQEDYIRTAYAKGLPMRQIVLRHGLRSTLIPVVTVLALQLGTVLSGAVITEAVFSWPGIGNLAMSAVMARDYALVQAAVIFGAAGVVFANLVADCCLLVVDPRLRS